MDKNCNEVKYKDLLRKFYFGNDKAAIEQYYHTASFLELFGIERRETCHTRFLTWLFNNSESVVRKFLYLVLKWSELQKRSLCANSNCDLSKALSYGLYKDSIVFESVKARSEAQSESDDYGKGNTDIVIDCSITIDDEKPNKNMHIVIENKIYSPETKKKENGKIKYQTDSYYDNYLKEYKNDINVFVFLKPVTTYELSQASNETLNNWCHCDKFIIINYQELVDFVLTPFVNSDNIDPRVKYIVKEYIKSLGKTTENSKYSNKQIMAMANDEKDLLVSFYINNRDLIYAALSAVVDSDNPAISEDERNNAEEWKKQEEDERKSGRRTKFRVTIDGQVESDLLYAYEVVARFAEYLFIQNKHKKINNIDIDKEIRNLSGPPQKKKYFSKSICDLGFYDEDKKRPRSHVAFTDDDQNTYYVTTQWSPNTENGDWQIFMKKVNEKYGEKNKFKIEFG